jgi:ubiquinone/menaquinone biosynthesis C-methylase UbiE
MTKDLFSAQADVYAKYRPTYPKELFNYILSFVKERNVAWDCATGNGQAAQALAEYFEKVEATDISEAQLNNAFQKENIHYQVAQAEHTPFDDNSFDLITVATAYHWLNWDGFHKEATRVGKKDCVVAVWSYHLFTCEDENVEKIIRHFYYDITAPHWDAERKFVDEKYTTIKFDFSPLPSKDFDIQLAWTKEQFLGYLQSWSAVQNYIKQKGSSPIDLIIDDVNAVWKDGEQKAIHFPLFLRIGRVEK